MLFLFLIKMKKLTLILILSILIIGCGARHVNKSEVDTKVENKTDIKDSTISKTDTSIKIIDTTSITEIVTEPIDSTKPMIIDNKDHSYQNVRFKAIKVKKGISILKVKDSIANRVILTHNDINTQIKDNEKVIDKEPMAFSWWWLIILIILLGLSIGWYEFK